MNTHDGYKKLTLDNTLVLLAGGGHKPLSDFALSGDYVYRAGDTMTGILHMLANQHEDTANTGALDLSNSDIYGVNSIKFADLSDVPGEGLQWYRDATHVDTFWVKSGVMYFTPNRAWGATGTSYTVLHTGNIGLYVGGNGNITANTAQANGSVYLTLRAGASYFKHNIVGATGISVTSDANGKITITGTEYSTTAYNLTFRNGSTNTVIYSPHSAAKYLLIDNVSLLGAAATVSSSNDAFKISTKVLTASISANNFGNLTSATALIDNSYGVAHIVGTSSNTYNLPNGDRYTVFSTRSGSYSSQIAMGNFNGTTNWTSNALQVWYRYRNGSSWYSWQRLLTYGSRMLSGLYDTNELSPITQSIIRTPNFLFGLDGSYVSIQYKQGSGSWTTLSTSGTNNGYTISNAYRKAMLMTKANAGLRLGNRSYNASSMNMAVGDGIRFIIDAGSISSAISTLYVQINSLFVYFSTLGHTCSITIKAQTYANYNSSFGGTWTTLVSSASIMGWAGGNMYYFDTIDFGGNPGQTGHYRMLMVEIAVTAVQSGATKTDPPILFHIAGYGGNSWNLPTDQSNYLRQLDGGYWLKPTIPNPTDYYWANVKVSSSSNSATVPTFDHIYINTSGSVYYGLDVTAPAGNKITGSLWVTEIVKAGTYQLSTAYYYCDGNSAIINLNKRWREQGYYPQLVIIKAYGTVKVLLPSSAPIGTSIKFVIVTGTVSGNDANCPRGFDTTLDIKFYGCADDYVQEDYTSPVTLTPTYDSYTYFQVSNYSQTSSYTSAGGRYTKVIAGNVGVSAYGSGARTMVELIYLGTGIFSTNAAWQVIGY